MDVVTGTDTSKLPTGADPLLAGVRRMTVLADSTTDAEAIFGTLARELLAIPGAEEIHIHHLCQAGDEQELVVIYLFDGEERLSYLAPRGERPPGVSWVASTGRSFVAADARELAASVPRLALVSSAPTKRNSKPGEMKISVAPECGSILPPVAWSAQCSSVRTTVVPTATIRRPSLTTRLTASAAEAESV